MCLALETNSCSLFVSADKRVHVFVTHETRVTFVMHMHVNNNLLHGALAELCVLAAMILY